MISKKVTVDMYDTDDASPIALLVQTAGKYASRITIKKENKTINAKSIMGMMAMGITNGDEIELEADGADAAEAITALTEFLSK